jgi:hypothetical protein
MTDSHRPDRRCEDTAAVGGVHIIRCESCPGGTEPQHVSDATRVLDLLTSLPRKAMPSGPKTDPSTAVVASTTGWGVAAVRALLTAGAGLLVDGDEAELARLLADLDLRARLTRVRSGLTDQVTLVTPVSSNDELWTLAAAFSLADAEWRTLTIVGNE